MYFDDLVIFYPSCYIRRLYTKSPERTKFLALKDSSLGYSSTIVINSKLETVLNWWIQNIDSSFIKLKRHDFCMEMLVYLVGVLDLETNGLMGGPLYHRSFMILII